MKKLSTPLLIVLAVAAAVCFNGWRGSRKGLESTSSELATSSNKLAEATAKLAELGAANETLRVQLNLQRTDLEAVSNHVSALVAQLKQVKGAGREVEARLASRETELSAARKVTVKLRQSIEQHEARISQLTSELATARTRMASQAAQMAGLNQSLNQSLNQAEAEKSVLLEKLSDPSVLRAQLAALAAKPSGKTGRGPLTLKPDGTVAPVAPRFLPVPEPADRERAGNETGERHAIVTQP